MKRVKYKTEMIREIAGQTGIPAASLTIAHDLIFEHLKMLINLGELVNVKHFGSFHKKDGDIKFIKSERWIV